MNAAGGYYSEPARQQRRNAARVQDMLARKERGDPYSQANLNQLTMGSRPGHYDTPGGIPQPTGGQAQTGGNYQQQRPDKPGGFTDPGKGSYGPHKAKGGLASLWK